MAPPGNTTVVTRSFDRIQNRNYSSNDVCKNRMLVIFEVDRQNSAEDRSGSFLMLKYSVGNRAYGYQTIWTKYFWKLCFRSESQQNSLLHTFTDAVNFEYKQDNESLAEPNLQKNKELRAWYFQFSVMYAWSFCLLSSLHSGKSVELRQLYSRLAVCTIGPRIG